MTEDVVNHPGHYNQYSGFEVIDVCEQLRAPDGTGNYNRGNAFKYLARAGWKNLDKQIEDLQKAEFYIRREIDRVSTDNWMYGDPPVASEENATEASTVTPTFNQENSPTCKTCGYFLKLNDKQMGDGRLLYNCESCHSSFLLPDPKTTLTTGYLKWPEPSDKLIAFAERAAAGKVEFPRGRNVYDVLGNAGWTLMQAGLLELKLAKLNPGVVVFDKWTLTANGERWLEKATNSWVEVDGDLEQYGTKEDTTRCPDCSSWLVQDPGMSMSWNCPNGHGCMEVSLQGGKWYPSSGKPQRCPTCADVLIVMSNSCLSGHGFYADNGNWVPLATGSRSVNNAEDIAKEDDKPQYFCPECMAKTSRATMSAAKGDYIFVCPNGHGTRTFKDGAAGPWVRNLSIPTGACGVVGCIEHPATVAPVVEKMDIRTT